MLDGCLSDGDKISTYDGDSKAFWSWINWFCQDYVWRPLFTESGSVLMMLEVGGRNASQRGSEAKSQWGVLPLVL